MRLLALVSLGICLPLFAAGQEFEAATIKPVQAGLPGPQTRYGVSGGPGTATPGMITWSGTSPQTLVATAFDVPMSRIANPGVFERAAFDVVAKVPVGTTKAQIPAMLRKLLAEQFHMTAHVEMRNSAVYLMTVAKGGSKLKPANEDAKPPDGLRTMGLVQLDKDMFPFPAFGEGASFGFNGATRLVARGVTTAKLADLLDGAAVRPIVDNTGLTGIYDVRLSFTPPVNANNAPPPPPPPGGSGAPGRLTEAIGPPDIFGALRDLGLSLVPGKAPVKFIVIDHMDKTPSGN